MSSPTPAPAVPPAREKVVLSRCASTEPDEAVVRATEEAVARLGTLPVRLRDARTVAVKINAGVDRLILTDDRQTEVTDPAVIEGAIRALRAQTDAELLVGDAPTDGNAADLYARLGLTERLSRYPGVRLVDFNASEMVEATMPHTDGMFRRYAVPRELTDAEAFVSLAKMKAHMSLGCTLSIKNLFGWMPTSIYGAPRQYLHDRLVRLPRVLADLARWLRPDLCVVDATAAANKSEWGGEALRPGVLLAGTNCVAVDSVGARVMGFDPDGDYPDHPFLYRRNVIRLCARAGLGPNAADRIEVLGPEPESCVTPFTVHGYDEKESPAERIARRNGEVRDGAACAAAYVARRDEYVSRYGAGRLLALRDGEVLWDAPDFRTLRRKEKESGRTWRDAPQLHVRATAPEDDPEVWEWYAREAEELPDPARWA